MLPPTLVDPMNGDPAVPPPTLRTMTVDDHEAITGLLSTTPGVTLRDADLREATGRYLDRNSGLSFVCEVDGRIAGCVMAGHDGRRGYLQHLVVVPAQRRRGIAKALVDRCLDELAKLGILKTHVDVLATNLSGAAFWQCRGWTLRTDIHRYSLIRGGADNA